jgi:hypothetical protein
VFEQQRMSGAPSVATEDRPRDKRCGAAAPRRLILTLAFGAGIALGACAIPFGDGGEPTGRSPEETRRDRSRLYLEEQERMERERTFDRVGPPSDR